MKYNRILTIQDISCFGQCSTTVALPILSACGLETCILPSAILSTHTAGFEGYSVHDLTNNMVDICEHWQKENITFDAFYTGYLGDIKQIDYVKSLLSKMGKENCIKFIDPAMADNGKLYPAFDIAYANAMRSLCSDVDVILPNVTEACFLTGREYKENYDEKYIENIVEELRKLNTKVIVLTGVSYSDKTTGVVVHSDNKVRYYEHKKISNGCHGTGDIYSSAFVGAYLAGKDAYMSAKIAADYTVNCIENTVEDKQHWYGAKFEPALPMLINKIYK